VSKTATGLTDMQYNRLKTQTDADYAGAENAGRPMLLEGDLDWKAMGFAPAEMEWLAGMKDARRLIATVLGFAPELIGDSENKTYGNYGEARKALYQETVLPQKDRDLAALNNWLVPMFGDNLYLDYDRDQIEALEEDHEKLWSRVEASSVLTVNEKRELLGYDDVSTEEGGDAVLVSAAMTPLDDLARQATEKGTGNGPQGSDGV
jgi:HK97 family phage portal protein